MVVVRPRDSGRGARDDSAVQFDRLSFVTEGGLRLDHESWRGLAAVCGKYIRIKLNEGHCTFNRGNILGKRHFWKATLWDRKNLEKARSEIIKFWKKGL